MFGHLLLKLGGGDRHTCNMKGGERAGACPWWGGKRASPPLEIEKKMLSEEILTSFTYVLLMKLGGIDIHCIHAKWKGVGGQALVHGGRRWGPCPPLENEKKASCQRKF